MGEMFLSVGSGLSFSAGILLSLQKIWKSFQGTLAPAWHCSLLLALHCPVAGRTEHGPLCSLIPYCFLHRSQALWLLARQGWQLKNPDAKLWTGLLFGLWLVPSLASALASQPPVSPSVELGSGLGFCWLPPMFGHCFPFELSLIMRNVSLWHIPPQAPASDDVPPPIKRGFSLKLLATVSKKAHGMGMFFFG